MTDDSTSRASPNVTLGAIAKTFFVIGCTAFGGGVSAHIHHAVVRERGWLDEQRFLEGTTVARIIPGTNVSNLAAFVGAVLKGRLGATVAVAAVNLPGVFAILALAVAYDRLFEHSEVLRHALRGLSAGAVGLMVSMIASQAKTVWKGRGALFVAAAACVGVGVLHLNLLVVLVALLPLAALLDRKVDSA